jgi:hypothetical protein
MLGLRLRIKVRVRVNVRARVRIKVRLRVKVNVRVKVRVRIKVRVIIKVRVRYQTSHSYNYEYLCFANSTPWYMCKTQIDVQSLIDVQFSNIWPLFTFSNRRPMTSLTFTCDGERAPLECGRSWVRAPIGSNQRL